MYSSVEVAKVDEAGHTMKVDTDSADTALVGLKVQLDRPVCCQNICIVGPGKGPHAAVLNCADCGQRLGWLSKPTAQWIKSIITRFGAPTTPVVVRKAHIFEEEAPPAET
jgi:hypothetical protein